ncbi:hypothetical protein L9F63_024325, partial [Diploptera punctata]
EELGSTRTFTKFTSHERLKLEIIQMRKISKKGVSDGGPQINRCRVRTHFH